MELKKLLDGVKIIDTNADMNYDVNSIKISSKDVCERDLFLCMKGTIDNGNKYIADISCDFVAITEEKPTINVKYVLVENVRRAYSIISQNYFERPQNGMKFVTIIGTNGKTSTAHYITSILSFVGINTGLIGTEGHYICGERVGESLTTPDPFELNKLFFDMRARGVEVVVSELSAHAIFLEKMYGLVSDVSILTNVSQDHLDYFKNFEDYKNVKLSYFTALNTKKAVINIDDKSGRELIARLEKSKNENSKHKKIEHERTEHERTEHENNEQEKNEHENNEQIKNEQRKSELNNNELDKYELDNDKLSYTSFGLFNPADSFAIDVRDDFDGVRFVANICDEIVEVRSSLHGEFNVYNLLSALTVCHELGLSADVLSKAAAKVKAVKGRFSVLKCDKGTVVIDFAHTPDGLKNLLESARAITKSRLITVFGCGGDRDKTKRKIMGEIAEKLSDIVVLTSDNSRFEAIENIILDIESGMRREHKTIIDRSDAVRFAIGEMLEGDTLVIAGKGSENYLDIQGKKIPYSDFETVARFGHCR